MENTSTILSENILKYRKGCGFSQEELAKKLGVTFQAVSKWETGKSAPDISFLPIIADIFGCSIDNLFSRKINTESCNISLNELPWSDDSTIRGVVYEGRKMLQADALVDRFTFEITGDAKNVQSECNIEVNGNVSGGCEADGGITVSGGVSGGCCSGLNIVVGGHLSGGCNSGGTITVGGHLSGGCNTGMDITCGGNISGDVNCGSTVTVYGNVEAVKIKGNVICDSLKCDKIEGNVTISNA